MAFAAWILDVMAFPRARLADVRQDSVQFVQAVIADDELALARIGMLQLDRRAELVGEVVLEPLDVRVFRARAIGLALALVRVRDEAADKRFGLAHREPLLRDQRADLGLLARGRQRKQRAGMAHFQFALLDQGADGLRQVEQAQQVRYRRARAADGLGGLLVRELELHDQAGKRERLLERVQVLALDVLDQGERDGVLVVDAPQHSRDLVQARHLRGAPDRKSTRLNSSHSQISYAVFCL